MADEIVAGAGGAGTAVQAELLNRRLYRAAYGSTVILPTARIESLAGQPVTVGRYSKHPILADASVTEVESIANTAWTPTDVSITTARFGLALEESDLHRMSAVVSGDELAMQAGLAVRQGIEIRGGALFPSFTTEVGTTATVLTVAEHIEAQFEIENANLLDRGPIVARYSPKQVQDLRIDIQAATGAVFGADTLGVTQIMPIGQAWDLWGVMIASTTNLTAVNTAADIQGAMYPAGAMAGIIYQVKRDPQAEIARGQAGARTSSNTIVVVGFYAWGLADPAAGVKVTSIIA